MKIINLVFDLDDTTFLTNATVKHNILEYLGQKNDWDVFDRLALSICLNEEMTFLKAEQYLDTKGKLSDLVFTHGLLYDRFMLQVKPDLEILGLLTTLNNNPLINLHVCTHRGYTKNGLLYTEASLKQCCPGIEWKSIHVLDSEEHPDKLTYLNKLFGSNYLLIDDMPNKSLDLIDNNPNVVVWTKHHSFPQFFLLDNVKNVFELNQHISKYVTQFMG